MTIAERKAYEILMRLLCVPQKYDDCIPYAICVASPTPEDSAAAFAVAKALMEESPFARARMTVNACKREIWLNDGSGVVRYVVYRPGAGYSASYTVRESPHPVYCSVEDLRPCE